MRVVTANVREGLAKPGPLAALARDHADVLLLQELSPELASNLGGLDADFPYRAIDAQPFASGIGIWSRHPIERPGRAPDLDSEWSRSWCTFGHIRARSRHGGPSGGSGPTADR